MSVLMTAQLPGATKEMIDEMEPLLDEIRGQKASLSTPTARCRRAAASSRVGIRRATSTRGSRTTSSQPFRRAPRHRRSGLTN